MFWYSIYLISGQEKDKGKLSFSSSSKEKDSSNGTDTILLSSKLLYKLSLPDIDEDDLFVERLEVEFLGFSKQLKWKRDSQL